MPCPKQRRGTRVRHHLPAAVTRSLAAGSTAPYLSWARSSLILTRFPTLVHFPTLLCTLALACGLAASRHRAEVPDRRIVDAVTVANRASELAHGYAGYADSEGVWNGVPFRQSRGWMHFALKTFDDTDVTLAFSFVVTDSVSRRYDVVVEDSLIASRTFEPARSASPVVDVPVPFALTKGKTSIVVYVRARDGITPPLREVRTIQDHNEFAFSSHFSGATR